jgi:5-formyltetrahydrofolate cyclo-ligase
LLAARRNLSRRDQNRGVEAVTSVLNAHKPALEGKRVAFYWPTNGEVDLVRFIRTALRYLRDAALPVITEKHRPLEFWRWSSRTQLCNRGPWNIPSPVHRILVEPQIVFVPLLGFDESGYRLGYGSGYYDRTLAAMTQRAWLIGIGQELGRLGSIYPQPHDVPMDAIVTERGIVRFRGPRLESVAPSRPKAS